MGQPTAAMYTDDFLEELRSFGDPEADDVVNHYMDHLEIDIDGDGFDDLTGKRTNVFRRMLSTAVGNDEHGPEVAGFIGRTVHLPDWAEPARIIAAQNLFHEYAPQFGLGLWMASIPSGYAGERDAAVLWESIRCVSQPRARFFETGQFVVDVTRRNGLFDESDPRIAQGKPPVATGPGTRDIRHVRLVHGLARYLVKHDELTQPDFTWTPRLGEPVNQMALLATMFTFCVVGVESLEKFGIRVPKEDRENYTHLWNVVGHLLGIREDLLPLDFENSKIVWERIQQREYKASPQGAELTAAAIEALESLIPGRLLRGFPATGMRELIGKETADLLQVPPANWTRSLLAMGRGANRIASKFNRDVPLGRMTSAWVGRSLFSGLVGMENARAGDRDQFELDDELRKRILLRSKQGRKAEMADRVARIQARPDQQP